MHRDFVTHFCYAACCSLSALLYSMSTAACRAGCVLYGRARARKFHVQGKLPMGHGSLCVSAGVIGAPGGC